MRKLLQRMGIPEYIYLDEGSEFQNEQFLNLMKEHNIEVIFTLTHAPMVERLNRTIKDMLYKYLQSTGTKTITNVLPKIIQNYNNSYHKTIGMAPNEVNESNQELVHQRILSKSTRNGSRALIIVLHVLIEFRSSDLSHQNSIVLLLYDFVSY